MMTSSQNGERRSFGRRDSQLHAQVLVHGRAPISCLVTNLSSDGAYLVFDEAHDLPSQIRLRIESDGLDRRCCVKRRQNQGYGVQFIDTSKGEAPRREGNRAPTASTPSCAQLRQEVFGDRLTEEVRPLSIAAGRVIREL